MTTVRGFGGRKDWISAGANAVGLGVTAAAGLLVSIVLARGAGAAAVGQFNQLAAIYVVASQFAALGLHLSVLRYMPIADPSEQTTVAHAALVAVLPPVALISGMVFALSSSIEALLDSPGLAAGVHWVSAATGIFAVNKVILSLLNVFGCLIWMSCAQALRPLVWLVAVNVLLGDTGVSQFALGAMFVMGELAVMLFAMVRLAPIIAGRGSGDLRVWIERLLRFGLRAFPSNAITELNTRIDVLVLAVFASDRIVGIYGFAALIAEGVFQIGVFMRVIINNRLVTAVVALDALAVDALLKSTGRVTLGMSAIAGLTAFALTPALIDWFRLDPSLNEGWWILGLLVAGVVGGSRYAPFWNILMLSGRPGLHSVLMLSLLVLNLVLNAVAIPVAGMTGAGVATAATFLIFPFFLRFASRRVLGLQLGA